MKFVGLFVLFSLFNTGIPPSGVNAQIPEEKVILKKEVEKSIHLAETYFENRCLSVSSQSVIMILSLLKKKFNLKLDIPSENDFKFYYPELKNAHFGLYGLYFNDKDSLEENLLNQMKKGIFRNPNLQTDHLTLWSVYCHQLNLSSEFYTQIESNILKGGYSLTHAMLQLKNALKNECALETRIHEKLMAQASSKLQLLLNNRIDENHSLDLRAESAAVLLYGDNRNSINHSTVLELLNLQNPDGGWSIYREQELSNDHTTVLMYWALLEIKNRLKD